MCDRFVFFQFLHIHIQFFNAIVLLFYCGESQRFSLLLFVFIEQKTVQVNN
jgi:hypothetical protein